MPIAACDAPYEYALVRVVPCVVRGEFCNVGVILSCPSRDFLASKIELDAARVLALFPAADIELLEEHLDNIRRVCDGDGPIGKLPQRARFHWLTAPRSTIIQTSPAHSGLCLHPQSAMDDVFDKMVAPSDVSRDASTRNFP